MKNFKILLIALLLLSILTVAGCRFVRTDKKATEQPTSDPDEGIIINFSYSDGIDENGFWKDIRALDYVELCNYINIEISKDIHEVSEDDINDEINYILSEFVEFKEVKDRAVKDKDTVNIDYVGKINGKEFEGGSTNGEGTEVTIGETQYIDDFLEQLIGHKPGETFDIEVTFPDDYGVEELNGKDAVFTVTINFIIEEIYPELTDEFVKEKLSEFYGWNKVSEMKEAIRNNYQRSAISDYVYDYVIKNSKVSSVPESMIKYQENMMIHYFQTNAKMYGMKFNDFISLFTGASNLDELIEMYAEGNRNTAVSNLVIQAIAEDLKLTVSEEEVKNILEISDDEYDDIVKEYGLPYLKMLTINNKVYEYLVDNAKLL